MAPISKGDELHFIVPGCVCVCFCVLNTEQICRHQINWTAFLPRPKPSALDNSLSDLFRGKTTLSERWMGPTGKRRQEEEDLFLPVCQFSARPVKKKKSHPWCNANRVDTVPARIKATRQLASVFPRVAGALFLRGIFHVLPPVGSGVEGDRAMSRWGTSCRKRHWGRTALHIPGLEGIITFSMCWALLARHIYLRAAKTDSATMSAALVSLFVVLSPVLFSQSRLWISCALLPASNLIYFVQFRVFFRKPLCFHHL